MATGLAGAGAGAGAAAGAGAGVEAGSMVFAVFLDDICFGSGAQRHDEFWRRCRARLVQNVRFCWTVGCCGCGVLREIWPPKISEISFS